MKRHDVIEGETQFERNQRFNALVAWQHGRRYKTILKVFDRLAASAGGRPIRILDIGCAHAKLFALLNHRLKIDYTGVELQDELVKAARERYQGHSNFRIIQDPVENLIDKIGDVDVVVALETLEHIPEDVVVRLVEDIAKIRPKLFVSSVPVEIGPAVWFKNLSSLVSGYVRHRDYTWKETFWAGLGNLDKLPPHGTCHKGFDWRWLAQTIRHNFNLVETRKIPWNQLPVWLSTSVFLIAEPRPEKVSRPEGTE
jgi:SAM-dependent methyltransferase